MLLPARNKKDIEELSEETKRALELVWLENVEEAAAAALEPAPASPAAAST